MAFICLHDHEIGVLMSLSSAAEIKVYINLLQRRNAKTKTAHPGYGRIARDIGASRRTVARALRELQRCGLIQWERRTVPNRDEPDSNLYTFPIHDAAECGRGSVTDDTRVVSPMTLGSVTDGTQTRRRQLDESREDTQLRCPVAEGDAAAASDSETNDERSGNDHRRMWAVFAEVLGWAPVEACERAGDVESRGGWNTYIRRLRERGVTAETLPQVIVRFRVERPGYEPTPYQVWRFVVGPRRARRQETGAITPAQLAALRERFAARETAQDRPESPTSDETDTSKGETGTGPKQCPAERVERVAREPVVFGDHYGDRITRPTETIIRRRRRPAVQSGDWAMVAAAGGGD